MPIYAYKCSACDHAQDVLQKMSDPLLTVCPACGQNTYVKQVTAAGFQLKGTGWYVTDFRDGKSGGAQDAPSTPATTAAAPAAAAPAPVASSQPAAASAPAASGSTSS